MDGKEAESKIAWESKIFQGNWKRNRKRSRVNEKRRSIDSPFHLLYFNKRFLLRSYNFYD